MNHQYPFFYKFTNNTKGQVKTNILKSLTMLTFN